MNKEKKKAITDRIKLLRNKSGLTQQQMAEKVGLEYNSYVKMENAYNLPSIDVLMKVSESFNVSIDLIIYGNSTKTKEDISNSKTLETYFKLCDFEKLEYARNSLDDLINIAKKIDLETKK